MPRDDPSLVAWFELCRECSGAFERWQCAPNPGAWTNPKIQASPQLLAFLASCRATGPSPEAWRQTISAQLLLIRRICSRWHASRRVWEPLDRLGYAGWPPHPCRCLRSFAAVTPTHPGHCCFLPAGQACHQGEVAEWEHQRDIRLLRSAGFTGVDISDRA